MAKIVAHCSVILLSLMTLPQTVDSAIVGNSGSNGVLLALVTAIPRNYPLLM